MTLRHCNGRIFVFLPSASRNSQPEGTAGWAYPLAGRLLMLLTIMTTCLGLSTPAHATSEWLTQTTGMIRFTGAAAENILFFADPLFNDPGSPADPFSPPSNITDARIGDWDPAEKLLTIQARSNGTVIHQGSTEFTRLEGVSRISGTIGIVNPTPSPVTVGVELYYVAGWQGNVSNHDLEWASTFHALSFAGNSDITGIPDGNFLLEGRGTFQSDPPVNIVGTSSPSNPDRSPRTIHYDAVIPPSFMEDGMGNINIQQWSLGLFSQAGGTGHSSLRPFIGFLPALSLDCLGDQRDFCIESVLSTLTADGALRMQIFESDGTPIPFMLEDANLQISEGGQYDLGQGPVEVDLAILTAPFDGPNDPLPNHLQNLETVQVTLAFEPGSLTANTRIEDLATHMPIAGLGELIGFDGSILSSIELRPIPEPNTAWLLLLGVSLHTRLGRRQSASLRGT